MKKMILILGFLCLLVISLVIGTQVYPTDTNNTKSAEPRFQDEKIAVVDEFWNQASRSGSVDQFIAHVPDEAVDDTPRCDGNNENDSSSESEMRPDPAKEGRHHTRRLIETAQFIGKEQPVLRKMDVFRHWKDEAIVEVEFNRQNQPYIFEKMYFFLHLADGKWKIVLETSIPDAFNKEYAKNGCPQ